MRWQNRFVGDRNVGYIIGRAIDRVGIKIPDPAYVPPPAEPAAARGVPPVTVAPGESAAGAMLSRIQGRGRLCGLSKRSPNIRGAWRRLCKFGAA